MNTQATHRIRLILRKEWQEFRQQKLLLLGMLMLPILFTVMPLGLLFAVGFAPSDELDDLKPMLEMANLNPLFRGMEGSELAQALIGQPLSVLLLLTPAILPSLIASYSVVGEKVNRTLEPLLATPVPTWELLFAKMLGALVPAVGITWVFGLIFISGLRLMALSDRVFAAIISPAWFILFLICSPLLALIAIAATVAVSSRVSDPRSAQQICAVVIVPLILIIGGQFAGIISLNLTVAAVAAVVLALVAAGMVWLAVRLFKREIILTKWS